MKSLPAVLSGHYTLSDLFAFHNEHRIVTARLIFIIDAFLFSSAGFFPAIIMTSTLIVISAVFCISVSRDLKNAAWTTSVFSALLLSIAHSDNFSSGFQVQFPFVDLFAALSIAFFCLTNSSHGKSPAFLMATLATNLLAILSMASGNIVIVALVFAGILLRITPWKIALVVVFSLCFSLFYFQGYLTSDIPRQYSPIGILHFSIAYLGSALRGYAHAPTVLGATMLLLYVFILVRLALEWFSGRALDRATVWLTSYCAFVLCGAVITATGRLSLGLEAAVASRYAIQSLLFAGCLFLICWRIVDLRGGHVMAKLALAGIALALAATSTFSKLPMREWRERVADYDVAGFALAQGIVDERATGGVYPWLKLIRPTLTFMRQHHVGPFSAAFAEVYRPPLNAIPVQGLDELSSCVFHIDERIDLSEQQVWMQGWVVAKDSPFQDGWVVALGPNRQLLGVARQSIFRPDVAAALRLRVRRVGFKLGLNFNDLPSSARDIMTLILVPDRSTAPSCRFTLPPSERQSQPNAR